MSDVLAIVGPLDTHEDVVEEIVRRRPCRVTVLIETADIDLGSDESDAADAVRDRLALLMGMIEKRTDAAVVGLAGSRDQLPGWHFDQVVGGREPLAA